MKTVLHVCTGRPNSTARSFVYGSMKEALGSAKAKKADKIELRLSEGIYTGSIKVEKDIDILGNKGQNSETVLRASITNNTGKSLTIHNVTLDSPKKHAISQAGGRLTLQNVVIKGVTSGKAILKETRSYACICLSDSALLIANNINLLNNDLTAIRVEGEGTKAIVSDTTLSGNRVSQSSVGNPPILCGVIEVLNKGILCIENSLIQDNECIGIYIYENGQMHLRNTTVKGTKNVQDTAGNKYFGHNIAITSNAVAELHSFVSSNAESCGVIVDGAYLTAENGKINLNSIGIAFLSKPINNPTYNPFNCIYDNVEFVGNVTKIGGMYIPIPSLSNPDRTSCKIVPWG